MVAIVSRLWRILLAIQSAFGLSQFGAMAAGSRYVVIAFTRELGPLLTAIVVSGRSGSAISARNRTMVVPKKSTHAHDGSRSIELVLAPKYLAALIVYPASPSLAICAESSRAQSSCTSKRR